MASALSRIRENVGLVVIIIAIAIASFVIADFFKGTSGGPDNEIGVVSGQTLDYFRVQQKFELYEKNSPPDIDDQRRNQLKQSAWNDVVNEIVYGQEYDKIGITVTDDEVSKMFLGPLTHRYVQQFPWFFNDSTRQFSYDAVRQLLAQADEINHNDPSEDPVRRRFKSDLLDLERAIIQDRLFQKYSALLSGAGMVSKNEATRKYNEENQSLNITYTYVPYTSVAEDQVSLTDDDYKKVYDDVKNRYYRQDAEAVLKYTFFPLTPSPEDSVSLNETMKRLAARLGSEKPEEVPSYAAENTDGVVDTSYRAISDIPAAAADLAISGRTDSVAGPMLDLDGTMKVFRVTASMEDSVNYNHLRHILIVPEGPTQEDSTAAQQKARDLARQLRGGANFADLVVESKDFQTSAKGGDLGWMAPGGFGDDFDGAVNNASVGQIVTTESVRGYHVVEVLNRTNKRFKVFEIQRGFSPSSVTTENVYKLASRFASDLSASGNMDSLRPAYPTATVLQSPPLTQDNYDVIGLQGARSIVTWAFKADEGQTSEILEAENAFVIATLVSKREQGVKSLEEIKAQLQPEASKRKKAEMISAKLQGGGDPAALAQSYGQGATSTSAQNLKFVNPTIGGSREPYVVGRAFGLQQGQTSAPIRGESGVYVVRVDQVNAPAEVNEGILAFQKSTLQSTKSSTIMNNSMTGLREIAKVKDYRYKFDF